MNEEGEVIGAVKEIQDNGISLKEAKAGSNVAISMDGVTFGRQIKENETLYVFINDENERALRYKFTDMLDNEEKALLEKTAAVKAKAKKPKNE